MEPGVILNKKTLDALAHEVGSETMPLLINSLCNEIQTAIGHFDSYYSELDWHALEIEAHALKSATASFGADRLSNTCQAIEYSLKEKTDLKEAGKLLSKFKIVAMETIRVLDACCGNYKAR